ncbi:RRP15-like protein isoform X1 [Ipomoea triloba]|uniref:RRP15-like protein isoform X1 n=1 Tax=Ipomoea triloba TaxID=35885 RepID=UPI00125DFB63|nr:RRP15-like protein isoform X1 [Ipomoea triloba]
MTEVHKGIKRGPLGSKKRSGKVKKKQKMVPFNEKKPKIDKKMRKLFEKRARDYNSDEDDEDDKDNEVERSGKAKKKQKTVPFNEKKPKIDKKMRKLFEKRAKDNNSDEDDEDDKDNEAVGGAPLHGEQDEFEEDSFDEEGDGGEEDEVSEDEGGELQPGITKFTEGCKAFRMAFRKLLKKTASASDDVLGPVLSAHKKLVAEKLAEEETERKVKGEAKKEKHLIGEKGHVKPANYLDSHEKLLIGIATKGVVKLFNAVNKAQHAQRGLNPSRAKDEKTIKKRKKEAFFSELGKTSSQSTSIVQKVGTSGGSRDKDGPAWAPLRDNYMLANPKLKDWDKKPDTALGDDSGMPADTDSSSDDD